MNLGPVARHLNEGAAHAGPREPEATCPMTCREITEILDRYLEGELPAEARGRFEAHLAICPDCRRYLDSYRASSAVARAAMAQADDIPEGLVQAILSARSHPT
jgi:anti-sigma factor RsiW